MKAWWARHPRFYLHFTPTGSSWLNLVERFFRGLIEDMVREGSFTSAGQLVRAMETYFPARPPAPMGDPFCGAMLSHQAEAAV